MSRRCSLQLELMEMEKAWAVVESENKDSWTWFLSYLKKAIPESVGMTLISDRDKGLLAGEETAYGNNPYINLLLPSQRYVKTR